MPEDSAAPTLRVRKQRRTRDAIVRAAYELFAERGFAAVTVAEIADRAEVGRTTFFRYFGDKQEVLFGDDADVIRAVSEHVRREATAVAPIGDSLGTAIGILRGAVAKFATGVSEHPERVDLQLRLLADHPELHGRYLLKKQRQIAALTDVLAESGASRATATLATQLAFACLQAAGQIAAGDPKALRPAIDDAFSRLAAIAG